MSKRGTSRNISLRSVVIICAMTTLKFSTNFGFLVFHCIPMKVMRCSLFLELKTAWRSSGEKRQQAGFCLFQTVDRHVFPFLGHGNPLRNLGSNSAFRQNSLAPSVGEELPGSEWHKRWTNRASRRTGSLSSIGRKNEG